MPVHEVGRAVALSGARPLHPQEPSPPTCTTAASPCARQATRPCMLERCFGAVAEDVGPPRPAERGWSGAAGIQTDRLRTPTGRGTDVRICRDSGRRRPRPTVAQYRAGAAPTHWVAVRPPCNGRLLRRGRVEAGEPLRLTCVSVRHAAPMESGVSWASCVQFQQLLPFALS